MMVGTHSLLPVCCCLLVDKISRPRGQPRLFTGWNLCLIGLFGFLPDILSPHLSLEARQSSLSHTVWALAVMAFVVVPVGRFCGKKGSRVALALACWIAYMLHLAADAISGGIAWLYPWKDVTIGSYLIPSPQWIYYDAGFIILVWMIYRVFPHFTKKKAGEERSLDQTAP